MDFQNDPELEKLFKEELDERAGSLASGARAMADGDLTPELAGKMSREGHTIKGTGRVMGYEAIARGGETAELVWRWIQGGELQPSSMLARTLEHLAQSIPEALGGSEHDVSVAIDTVRALVIDDELLSVLPEPMESFDDGSAGDETAPAPTTIDEAATDVADVEPDSVAASPDTDPADETSETASDDDAIDQVAATLDQIEREIEAASASPSSTAPTTIDLTVEPVMDAEPTEAESADAPPVDSPTQASGPDTDGESGGAHVADLQVDDPQVDDPQVDQAEVGTDEIPADVRARGTDAGSETESDVEDLSVEARVDAVQAAASPPDRPEAPDHPVDVVEDMDGPLVFEPGPDGKLPTPVITYEIVSSAFADVAPVSDAARGDSPDLRAGPPQAPASLSIVEQPSVLDPESGAVYDLGGLVGAVETWATEESVPVNAGRLFRMINDVAALRIDLESALAQAAHLLQSADGISAAAMEGSLEMLETVRRASVDLERGALGLTTTQLAGVTSTLPQLVKYLAKKVDRDIQLVVEGEHTGVDRQLVDRIGEVIRQLVVNAVAHGIEPPDRRLAVGKSGQGIVTVSLSRNDEHVQIVVTDDGAGIDWKAVRETAEARGLTSEDPTTEELRGVLYSEGFSTSPEVTEFTGDGQGLSRVTEIVEQVFGTLSLESTPGRGTTFVVTLPAHRALQSAQIFTAGGRSWGIPASSVAEVLALPSVAIEVTERGSFISYGREQIPYSSFSTVAGLDVEGLPSQVLVVQSPTGQIALAVDDVSELRQVATKDLNPLLSGSSVVSGVALLGGDETVMLVDAGRLAERMREIEIRPEGPVHSVLVVDDSQGVRQVVSGVLASHGFSTLSAGSVSDALAALAKHTVDALVVDFSMPRADGVALIHMVRQRYGDIPVVMLSGVANDEDRSRAERAGADAFFDKADFAKGALVEKLRELVDTPRVAADQGMAS